MSFYWKIGLQTPFSKALIQPVEYFWGMNEQIGADKKQKNWF